MNRSAPIGVFDSGIGGLTVVRELIELMPGESVVYLGDTARVPYGIRSPDTVRRYALEGMRFLLSRGIKFLVVACNTVSSVGLEELSRDLPV
ncbi:MAG: glutamate racemase, partial [Nitrospirota bacterium]